MLPLIMLMAAVHHNCSVYRLLCSWSILSHEWINCKNFESEHRCL